MDNSRMKKRELTARYEMDLAGSGYDNIFRQSLKFHEDGDATEMQVVNIYPELTYETFEGFGGAVTEASGYIYSLMSDELKRQLVETYYSESQMNYSIARVHIDSCDACLGMYEAMSDPNDTELASFSFERTEKYILPLLEDIKAVAGDRLKLMLSPWSPPVFMKTNSCRTGGGRLKPEYYGMWAKYLCRYIKEFQDRGYCVQRLSIQNESNAVQVWDSCLYTASEEKTFLRDYLYPTMESQGLSDVEVFIWDHNKERIYERVRDTVDDDTKGMVAGAAFHWYSGDHFEAMDLVRAHYPNLKMVLSESCFEYRLYGKENTDIAGRKLCHELVGDLSHGACAVYDWNILLDGKGRPNHASNFCTAQFMYDTETGELNRQNTQRYYYYLSHHIVPGSVRIAVSKYTELIDAVAYLTPEGKIKVALWNKSDGLLPVNLRLWGRTAESLLPPYTLAICTIE